MRISINQTLIIHLSGGKKAREIIERDYREKLQRGIIERNYREGLQIGGKKGFFPTEVAYEVKKFIYYEMKCLR